MTKLYPMLHCFRCAVRYISDSDQHYELMSLIQVNPLTCTNEFQYYVYLLLYVIPYILLFFINDNFHFYLIDLYKAYFVD